jgi:ribosomal-protein-alanine N-acetyltransferase
VIAPMTAEPPYSISRLIGEEGLDEVASLEAESFANPWSRDMLATELRNSDVARVYVLRDREARLVAFCACWIILNELHINTLAVTEDARRRGLATRLLRHIFAEAARDGADCATLEVRRSNEAALRLYEGFGFKVRGLRKNYYPQPPEDGLVLWTDKLGVLDTDTDP